MLIKICCIQNEAELHLAAAAGATHVGLVGAMPSGPGPIPDIEIARIAVAAPRGVTTVLLTARTDAEGIIDHVRFAGVRGVQIVTPVPVAVRTAVRAELPDIDVLQVVHVEGPESLAEAVEAARSSTHVLLDSGRPRGAVPELGGTGRTHDWSVSARIVARLDVPVFLAGGLQPDNVRAAVAAVRPDGLDVCSGIRDSGTRLDASRLSAFLSAVGSAGP